MRLLSDRVCTLQNTPSPERLFCTVFARRLRMSHYLSYTRAHRPFPRYARVHVVISTLQLFTSFPVKESLHFTFTFLCSGCKPKKNSYNIHALKCFSTFWFSNLLYFLVQKRFLSLHAVFWPATWVLWRTCSVSEFLSQHPERQWIEHQGWGRKYKQQDSTTTKHITLVALFLLPLFLVHRANDINDSK